LYRLSAEQGNKVAQNYLGVMYVLGHGVSENYVLAHMWFNFSASLGLKEGAENKKRIETKMTSMQIEKAKQMAKSWKFLKK